MAKYTLDDIMCGDKYNIESDVFMEVFSLVEQKAGAKMIHEQLNTIYVKHALLVAKKMHDEGDCISDDGLICLKNRNVDNDSKQNTKTELPIGSSVHFRH